MNYRLHKPALVLVALLVLVAAGLFVWTLTRTPQTPTEPPVATTSPQDTEEGEVLTAQHQFKDGIHTVAGTLQVPTPCHRVATEPFFTGSARDTVEIRFTTSSQDEMCAQVLTDARFKTAFEAPAQASIQATLNGKRVRLNLVPVPAGQDLDDFEIFIKG